VDQIVSGITASSSQLNSRKWYELALSCIDLTTLNSTDSAVQGEKMARKVT
jgi:hypothetical protein